MKTITFLLIAFLVSCVVTLKRKTQNLKSKVKNLEEITISKDSLINQIQASNRKYIDIALRCNAEH